MGQIYACIHKEYKNFRLNMELSVPGQILGVLGASGCGKSMTLKAIAGIITPDKGKAAVGERIVYDSDRKIDLPPQKRKVGYLFQNYALFPNMTVYENIAAAAGKDKSLVKSLIRRFHLEETQGLYPDRLSGGQQQRTALARILASGPEALLLDEPFSALDSYMKEELQMELKERLQEFGGPVMIVSHDRDELYRLCDHIMVMSAGENLICKGTKELFEDPEKMEAARLTGCKNITPAVRAGEREVEAKEWGVRFTLNRKIPERLKYIGIRAHDFRPAGADGQIRVEAVSVTDAPFERNVLFKNADCPRGTMWMKLDGRDGQIPERVSVREDKILLLE